MLSLLKFVLRLNIVDPLSEWYRPTFLQLLLGVNWLIFFLFLLLLSWLVIVFLLGLVFGLILYCKGHVSKHSEKLPAERISIIKLCAIGLASRTTSQPSIAAGELIDNQLDSPSLSTTDDWDVGIGTYLCLIIILLLRLLGRDS